MWATIRQKAAEAWKAIVAALIAAGWTAAIQANDAFAEWVTTQAGVWAPIAGATVASLGVWLKANRPPN